MKNLLQHISALLLMVALFVFSCQKDEMPLPQAAPNGVEVLSYTAPPVPHCGLPSCEQAVAEGQKRLLQMSENHCGTLILPAPCCDNGEAKTLMLQYKTLCKGKLPSFVDFTSARPLEGNILGLSVRRNECFAGGSSLEAVFTDTGTPVPVGPFAFHWWIDGQYQGSFSRLECAKGETAWLLVLDIWNGQKHFFEMPLYRDSKSR